MKKINLIDCLNVRLNHYTGIKLSKTTLNLRQGSPLTYQDQDQYFITHDIWT